MARTGFSFPVGLYLDCIFTKGNCETYNILFHSQICVIKICKMGICCTKKLFIDLTTAFNSHKKTQKAHKSERAERKIRTLSSCLSPFILRMPYTHAGFSICLSCMDKMRLQIGLLGSYGTVCGDVFEVS